MVALPPDPSRPASAALLVAAFAAQAILALLLVPSLGPLAALSGILPAATAGWRFGRFAGVASALAAQAADAALFAAVGSVPASAPVALLVAGVATSAGLAGGASRRLADRLAESEARFHQLAEGVHEVFWVQDEASRKLVYVSPRYRVVWGRDPRELKDTRDFLQTIHPEDRERIAGDIAEQGRAERATQYRIVRPDGTVRWIRDRSYPLDHHDRRLLVGLAEDITERKDLEDRYRLLFEGLPTPAWVYDFESMRILEVNNAAIRHYGYSREQFLSFSLLDLRPKDDVPAFMDAHKRADRRVTRFSEARHVKADGTLIDVIVTAANLDPLGANVALAVCQDVTERKRLAEAAAANERLAGLGTLVAGVAHEINNPLMYLMGNLEMSRLDLAEVAEARTPEERAALASRLDAALATALKGAEQIAGIARSLKHVAKQSDGARDRVDLAELVESVLVVAAGRLPPGTRVSRRTCPEPVVRGSRGELTQVLLNLVLNAADAIATAERPRIDVTVDRGDGALVLRVRDNGVGMEGSVAERVFTPFYTTKPHGTGLGLSVSRGIARAHGGDLAFSSVPGEGTTFELTLPRAGLLAAETPVPIAGVGNTEAAARLFARDRDARLRDLV